MTSPQAHLLTTDPCSLTLALVRLPLNLGQVNSLFHHLVKR